MAAPSPPVIRLAPSVDNEPSNAGCRGLGFVLAGRRAFVDRKHPRMRRADWWVSPDT